MTKQLSRTDYSIRNVIVGSITQIINFILLFIARMVFIKILGVEILGINALFESILTALSLLDLGFGTAIAYSLYKPLADNNQKKIVDLMGFYAKIYNYLALIIFICGIAIIPLIPFFTKSTIPFTELIIYYVLLLLSTSLSYLLIYKTIIITADQKNYVIKVYNTLFVIMRTIIQIGVLLIWKSYIGWLIIHLVSVVGMNIILVLVANKMYPFLKQKPGQLSKKDRQEIVKDVKSLFLYKVSGVVINTSDNIIGSMFTSAVAVGIYSNYYMVVGTISTFFQSLLSSLTASIGNLTLSKDNNKQYQIFKIINLITFLVVGIIVSWLVVSLNPIIKLWLGEKMLFPIWVMVVIIAIFYFQTTAAPLWSFRDGSGAFREVKYVGFYMAIINIILSIVFAVWFGFGGVLLATLVSRLITVYWLEPLLLHKTVFKKKYAGYLLMRIEYFIAIISGCLLNYWTMSILVKDGIVGVMISMMFSAFYITIIFLIIFGRTSEWKVLQDLFIKHFSNKFLAKSKK
ncbi:MAG: oligosaccharide flippase family protein [Candidatus Saccharibacteria bacterium]|nr:oligosaccharide flippase family protein [Candidatus Saccharibacteria bacterium]